MRVSGKTKTSESRRTKIIDLPDMERIDLSHGEVTNLMISHHKMPHKVGASGYRGVNLERGRKGGHARPWKAQISVKGKRYHLGRYASPEEAARAYDKRAAEVYGGDAVLNFPGEHKHAV